MTELTVAGADFVGYRIEEEIGRGGMGVVYRAYDLRLKRLVALKLIAPEFALDQRFHERFARETELAMSLEHPNVVPIYDAGDVDGRLYLAMRLVPGSDLRKLLQTERALEPTRALTICRQVASALDAAHAKGLVHRDVKPSNVLLDDDEHVYLADFGLTRRLDEPGALLTDGGSIGTPAYFAPEQIEGTPVDGGADLYALGCVLYECLAGESVFPRDSRLAVAWAHLEEEPPTASRTRRGLPEGIDRVIKRALAKQPGDRYPSCGALVAAAEQALGLRRTARYRTPAIATLAVVVAVAASLAVAQVVRGGGAAAPPHTHANTLVRIDPHRHTVQSVIDVAARPLAVAAWEHTVWVYSRRHDVVSEVDAHANRVVRLTPVSARPLILHPTASGPVLAANSYGAWIVGVDHSGHGVLTLVPRTGGQPHDYRLRGRPVAVTTGAHAVWALVDGSRRDRLIRLNPTNGSQRVQWTFPVSSGADALTYGFKDVWIVGQKNGTLYRFDPRVKSHRQVNLDHPQRAGRPSALSGNIWVGTSSYRYNSIPLVDPSTVQIDGSLDGGPGTGIGSATAGAFGAAWDYDVGHGEVHSWHPPNPAASLQVTDQPNFDGSCLTSLAAGGGAIWVTLAPSIDFTCKLF